MSSASKEAAIMMRFWLGLGLAASISATPALGQDSSYSGEEPAAILERAPSPEFGADELSAILTPMRTRGLTAGTGIEPGAPGSGVVPDLKINFGFDSAELTPEARAQLDELARAMRSEPLRTFSFRIGGHTDAAGSEAYNDWLSQERANAVAEYLAEQHGISGDRLQASGLGERELADADNPMSWVNRRVEVRTLQ